MQLQDIRFTGQLLVESYGDKGFRLSNGRVEGSVLILPTIVEKLAATSLSDVGVELFETILEAHDDIEILILGTGKTHQFPPAEIRKLFIKHHIALETMETGAACRTYNILVSEDRRVAAAIIAI